MTIDQKKGTKVNRRPMVIVFVVTTAILVYASSTRYAMFKTNLSAQTISTRNNQSNTGASPSVNLAKRLDIFNPTKKSILESSWITLFPNLIKMVQAVDGDDSQRITSARLTLQLSTDAPDQVGKKLKARIIASDENGVRKTHGGDFFIAVLRRVDKENDGISCQVADQNDGSYSVECYLAWEGKVLIETVLMHPAESIYTMLKKYSSEKEYGVYMNTTMLNSQKKQEYTQCSVGFPGRSPDELCDYSNHKHGEKRMCLKPPSGKCSKIIWQEKMANASALKLYDKTYFRKGVNLGAKISGSGTVFQVSKPANEKNNFPALSKPSYDPMTPSGWFSDSKWISQRTKVIPFSQTRLRRCAKDKRLYFFGDSTIRQWYEFFLNKLQLRDYGRDNSIAWSQGRDAKDLKMNCTLQYQAHGPPLHNPGPEDSRPYISNSLDEISEGGNGTMIFITVGFHFELFDSEVFAQRIRIIKKSIKDLLHRLPGSKVVIKGLHYHAFSILCPTAWIAYKFDVMLRHEFLDMKNVVYFELWDFTVVARNRSLHPQPNLLIQIIELLLSHIC